MPVYKRKYPNGTITWRYSFDLPGSTRSNRLSAADGGFATKKQAEEAEAARRVEEKENAAAAAKGVTGPLPKTLGELLEEFCTQHGDENLADKTAERYREMAAYLSPELRAMPIKGDDALAPLHLTREWTRLRKEGGHHRRTGEARPLSRKTVSNIRGLVSSAFTWAVGEGLAPTNPVRDSVLARGGEHREAVALAPAQQRLYIKASTHPLLPYILEVSAGLGSRRGETLALRWTDTVDGMARIYRSLTQSKKKGLRFKETKSPKGRREINIPPSIQALLEEIRTKQAEFRAQYGPDYRRDLDLIFCNPDGSPLKPDSISSSASALRKRLKLPKGVSLHTLRHTHGSQLLAAGHELPAVSRRLGHSSPAVTAKIYSHILDGRDQVAAELWDELNAEGSPAATAAPRQHQRKAGKEKGGSAYRADTQNERDRPN